MPNQPGPRARAVLAALLGATAAGTLALVAALFPDLTGAGLGLGTAAILAGTAAVAALRPVLAAPAVAIAAIYLVLGPWAGATEAGATIWVAVAMSLVASAAARTAGDRREVLIAFGPFLAFAAAVAATSHSVWGTLGSLAPVLGGTTFGLWTRLRAAHRERLALAQRQARADERLALASRLHDSTTARLTRIVIAARTQHSPEIEADAQAALADLRRVVIDLRDAEAPTAPLTTDGTAAAAEVALAVDDVVARARAVGQHVAVDCRITDPLPRATADCVARVVEEGLTNARKHAAGAPVAVEVTDHVVRVVNPPAAADPSLAATGTGLGLRGLAARTSLVGGTLRHNRSADGGWTLSAEFA